MCVCVCVCVCVSHNATQWAQWSATRTDLFPPDFCEVLGTLHQGAPQHSAAVTKREIEKAFGRRVDEIFVSFNPRPIASGSVAQVRSV